MLLGDCSTQDLAQQTSGVIQAVLQGRNSAVLALGQPGSGKTHTLFSSDLHDSHASSSAGGVSRHQLLTHRCLDDTRLYQAVCMGCVCLCGCTSLAHMSVELHTVWTLICRAGDCCQLLLLLLPHAIDKEMACLLRLFCTDGLCKHAFHFTFSCASARLLCLHTDCNDVTQCTLPRCEFLHYRAGRDSGGKPVSGDPTATATGRGAVCVCDRFPDHE